MSYAVVLTENAKADLVSISRYIARDLQSRQNAASQLARLEKAIRSLNEMPERYRVYDAAEICASCLWIIIWFSISRIKIGTPSLFCVFSTAAVIGRGNCRI